MNDVQAQIVELCTLIDLQETQARSWTKVGSNPDNALVVERMIVVDRKGRTFRADAEGDWFEFKNSDRDLADVTHLTEEAAHEALKWISNDYPEGNPHTVIDFKAYADSRVRDALDRIDTATLAKDLLTAPYMNEARFKEWSRTASLLLEEGRVSGQAQYEPSIAYQHVQNVLAAAPFVMRDDGSVIPKDGVDVIYGPLLNNKHEDALTVFRIKHGDDWQENLEREWLNHEHPGMTTFHEYGLHQMSTLLGSDWLSQLDQSSAPSNEGFLVVEINNTANAAFVDVGREQEIGRIVASAADILTEHGVQGLDKLLFDTNGNSVGVVLNTDQPPAGDPAAGSVRLVLDLGNNENSSDHIATIVRDAAVKLALGKREFPLQDINGNTLGQAQRTDDLSRVVDGKVNLESELRSGNVYKADDGFSGIANGEYRFVVPDAEVGYGQVILPVFLVNAKGEVAPDYETPQDIHENLFTVLSSEEKKNLIKALAGEISFEEFERHYSGDEPELG